MTEGYHEPEEGSVLSEDGLLDDDFGAESKRRGWMGCLAVLAVLALILGGIYVGMNRGIAELREWLDQAPEDYPGPGTGQVIFQVSEGDSATAIGRNLEEEGVVASVEAFTEAAAAEPASTGIQPGFYELQEQMPAADALEVLVEPANMIQTQVTIPEGLRVVDVVDLLAKETDFRKPQFNRVLDRPKAIGLPAYAGGNTEGYLFPATYAYGPDATPRSMLKAMVDRWRVAAEDAGLEQSAAELGYTPHELMTIASLVEAEGRGEDMAKIARVIYNRLEGPGDRAGTNGRLQIDATINYALGRKGVVAVTTDEIQNTDSPYNTYLNPGLPPGPVEAPGDAAIEAAANPADGDWYYYVTVNLATGETKFAETYDEFLQYKAEYQEYCQTSDRC